MNRRLGAQKKPDVVVQVVILAEDNEIRDKLAEHDLHVQTIAEAAPIEVSQIVQMKCQWSKLLIALEKNSI